MLYHYFLLAFGLALLIGSRSVDAQARYTVYLGTYTDGGSQGIYTCEFDLKDGSLTPVKLAAETINPTFLAFHPTGKYLYAVNESEATISAFAMDAEAGKLTFLNLQPSQGGAPCHVSVDRAGKHVLAANYTGGSCLSIPIAPNGQLSSASSFQQHHGPKTNGHSINLDAANRFALCCDLGLDKVIVYAFDSKTGELTPHSELDTPKGTGPRHLAWHPNGKVAYVNGEHNMTVLTCDYDAQQGKLTQKQIMSTIPADVDRDGGSTAETVVHPSGKFVYVSNRDPYNSIAIFAVDPESFELSVVGHQSAGIKTPRNFAIEPTGQFMLVANQSGGNVCVFRIDQKTGELEPTGTSVDIANAVCVRFMEIR